MWFHITLCVLFISGLRAQDFNQGVLKFFLYDKCEYNGNVEAFVELEESLENIPACITPADLPTPTNLEEVADIACNKAPAIKYGCLEELLNKLEPCLHSEEKYLPDFLLRTLNATVEVQCRDGGQRIIEQLNQNFTCRSTKSQLNSGLVKICAPKLKILKDLKFSLVLSESYLCSELEIAIDCAVPAIKEICENDTITKFLEDTLGPLLSECRNRTSKNVVDVD